MPNKSALFFSRKNIGVLLCVVVIIFIVIAIIGGKPKEQAPITPVTSVVEVKKSECPPLAQGKEGYEIRTDNHRNPQILEVDFDPVDVKIGEAQTVTVKVLDSDNNPITERNTVKAVIATDNKNTAASLLLIHAADPGLTTTWEGSWVNDDTHCVTYMVTITAISDQGEHSVDISFR